VQDLPAGLAPVDLPRYIVVEGAIGVGKTTLVGKLSDRLNARTVYEVFEENPFLADFYRDPDHFAFQTEMFFLLSRYRQQEEFSQEDLFSRFSVSDYLFVKCRMFGGMTLREHEFTLFDRVYGILGQSVPQPDLVVYLHAPLDVLLERIAHRGRSYEQDMDPNYLSKLLRVYTDYFAGYNETPLLTVDTTHVDFTTDEPALDDLLREIARTGGHRREFRAS
jgi:deoxyadenosine/deoxycytidine kinase